VKKDSQREGILYICGTPIGNLKDITLRALNTLREVDLIAAEDTRRTKNLLNHYQINTPVTSYYEHNKLKKAPYLIVKIKEGKRVALVSDAGMPGISDPGYLLINLALQNNIQIIPVPGVSALVTALVISGLPSNRFVFEGFLPRKNVEEKRYLAKIKDEKRTLVFYEAPHRLKKTLKNMLEEWGDRKMVMARELTKKYEEILRGKISQILEEVGKREIRGEITLVVEGQSEEKEKNNFIKKGETLEEFLKELKLGEYSNKEIIKITQEKLNIPKKVIYKKLLEMKNDI